MPYIGRSTDGFGVRNRFLYLASASDTSVSGADANGATLTFTDGAYVDVYLNGVLLKAGTDYNTNTANTIAGLSALAANDEVTVIVYDVFTVGDMVSATSGGTFIGNVTHNGTVTFGSTVSGLDVNGTEIILDADGDTTITADTDDQIDIKIAGADDFQFTANTFTALSGSSIATNTISETTSGSGVTIDSVLLKDGGIDVNGNEIILDADGDTSITADTDDQIDFRTGGTDRMSINSNGQIFIGNTSGTLPSGTMGVNSAGRHIIANDGGGFLLLQDNSTAAEGNGFDIHMGGVPAGTATLFSGGSIGGFVENASNADGYLKFSTSLNGTITEAARINSDGILTKVKNPHFIGGVQSTVGSTSGYNEGSGQNMIANVSQDNTGSHYNTSNGEFTCPVTGVYQVNFHGFLHTGDSTSNYSIQIHLNSSIMQYAYFAHVNGYNTYMSYSTSIRAAATNVLTIKLMNGRWYAADWRYFGKSICLLG